MEQLGIVVDSFDFLAIRPDAASMKAIQDKVDEEIYVFIHIFL